MSKFAVTLNYHGNYGYVEYDSENKKAEIVLGVAEAKAKVEKFLNEKLTLDVQAIRSGNLLLKHWIRWKTLIILKFA